MNKKLIVGNWKMNPATVEEARHIAQKTRRIAGTLLHTTVVMCPPFVYLSTIIPKKASPHSSVGAQTVSYEEGGPHTGQVSATMLRDMGVTHVIIGHSEERKGGDTDADVARRIKAVLDAGLTPIVCVGETERNDNGSHFDFLKEQIKNSFADIAKKFATDIVVAYEPVWAIGAKEAMIPEQVYEMSLFVRKVFSDVFGSEPALKVPVLYGGSVNPRNAADIIKIGKVDGLLVGRESVNVVGFVELLKAVDQI